MAKSKAVEVAAKEPVVPKYQQTRGDWPIVPQEKEKTVAEILAELKERDRTR
jgi:hypothetical protein